MSKYLVQAAASQLDLDENGAAVELRCDTRRDAIEHAHYYLTGTFAKLGELTEPLTYARVMLNGQCVYDCVCCDYGDE